MKIHVLLINEIVPVWRPVLAFKIQDNIYEILSDQEIPEDEEWEFGPGSRVCVEIAISDGQVYLKAVNEA